MSRSDSSDGLSFDGLMAQMGVRRLEGPASAKSSRKPAAPAARSPGSPAPAREAAPPGAPSALTLPAAPARPDPSLALAEQARDLARAELEQGRLAWEEERQGLVAAAAQLSRRLVELEEERSRLLEERQQLDEHRRSLQRRLEGESPERHVPIPVDELLQRRDLHGEVEVEGLMRALAEQRLGGALLRQLAPLEPPGLAAWLEDKVALYCGEERCAPPPGRAALRVPPARCEVCGGSDVQRAARTFVDACLMAGVRRVTIVGGSPRYHRVLRELVRHRSLEMRLVTGTAHRPIKSALADLESSDVVLIWASTLLDHSLSELYLHRGVGRALIIPIRGIARMLEQAARELQPRA